MEKCDGLMATRSFEAPIARRLTPISSRDVSYGDDGPAEGFPNTAI